MKVEVFEREEQALASAKSLLDAGGSGEALASAFPQLVKGYGRLLRQSRRLVTMGDRMQQSLNDLNRDLAVSEEKFRGIFENVAEGIYRCDASGRLIEANPAMAAMFGFVEADDFLASVATLGELFCEDADYARYEKSLASGGVHRMEVKACGPEGVKLWAEVTANVMREDGDGDACCGVVGVLADVTERKHMVEEMCRLARTDSLTGLWNRGYFMELAARELARSMRNGKRLSFLIIDADYFKSINDSYGHDAGDKALIALSQVLLDSVREVDVVGRFGGEEFVVLLPEACGNDACQVAQRILDNVSQTAVDAGEEKISMTVSIGLSSLKNSEGTLDGLAKCADIALYAAKKNGRNRVEIYRGSGCDCPCAEESHPKDVNGRLNQ